MGVCCGLPAQHVKKQSPPLYFQIPIDSADGTFSNIFSSHPSQAKSFSGVGDWIPQTTPYQGDCFHGIDRAADPYRLAGLRVKANGTVLHDALMLALQQNYREDGNANSFYLPGSFGDKDYTVPGPCGDVAVKFDDTLCGRDAFLLQDDTWILFNDDGHCAIACVAPGYNVRIIGLEYGR
jgi:hypothetical protein